MLNSLKLSIFHILDAIHSVLFFFFFNDTATTEIYTLSLHDALPICKQRPHASSCIAPLEGERLLKSPRRLAASPRLRRAERNRRCLFLQRWFGQPLAQILHDLLDQSSMRSRENKQILRALFGSGENDQVLREKLRLAGHDRALQVNCARKRAPTLARHENDFVWVFVRGDERAEKIRWNAPPAPANARRSPGDCFVQNIFLAENGRQPRRRANRQLHWHVTIGRPIQFFPSQPNLRFHGAQNSWGKIEERSDAD